MLKDLNESVVNPNFKVISKKKEEKIEVEEIEINGEKFFDVRKLTPPNPLMFVTGKLMSFLSKDQFI